MTTLAEIAPGGRAHIDGITGYSEEGDYAYAIGELKPDVVVQLWEAGQAADDLLAQAYTTVEVNGMLFSALTDSPSIHWDRVSIQP